MASSILVSVLGICFVLPLSLASLNCTVNRCNETIVQVRFQQLPLSWYDAQEFCRAQGGDLLQLLNSEAMTDLQTRAAEMNVLNCSWWVGRNLSGNIKHLDFDYLKDYVEVTSDVCPYIVIHPVFHLEITSDCSQRLGYLCGFGVIEEIVQTYVNYTQSSIISNHTTRLPKRVKRVVTANSVDINDYLTAMTTDVKKFRDLAQTAANLIQQMEQGLIQATYSQKMEYLQAILNASYFVAQNDPSIGLAFNCTTGMFLLSTLACGGDVLSNSQHAQMSNLVLEIYQQLSFYASDTSSSTTITTPLVTIYTVRQTTNNLANSVIGVEGEGPVVRIPSLSAFNSQLKPNVYINAQMTSFKVNPFPINTNENITGAVCSLVLRDDASEIKVSNMSECFEIYLPYPAAPVAPVKNATLSVNTMINTAIDVIDTGSTIVFTIEPSANVSLMLQLAYKAPPIGTNFVSSVVLNQTTGYRWLIDSKMLRTALNGTWYVTTSMLNPVGMPNITVRVSYFPIKCLFWNTTLEEWSTDGCFVGPQSEPYLVQCFCNHLTVFGSSLLVMPNSIDLSRTAAYFATVKENFVVPVLLGSFYLVYLVILIWACRADKQASRKRKITIMTDGNPSAQYAYLLSVYTGQRTGAGTSAQVEVTMIGSEGDSEPRILSDPNKPLFERGGVDMFVFATPFSLGELKSIRLSHDDSGGHPSWYLHKVTIQDLQTKRHWQFLCSSWLSSSKGDGMTKRTFHTAQNSEITSFGNIFQSKTSTGFRDQHIWMSVVNPPRQSQFTRAQRVSCCMCLLLCTMAINIMFFNVPQNKSSPIIFNVGSVEITLQDLMVGIQSGLLMFPINILIVAIFRHTKPRIKTPKEKHSDSEEQKGPVITMSTLLKDVENLVIVLSKNKKNKVMAPEKPLESCPDIYVALESVNKVLQLMQGESDSDPHWAQCSQFVLSSLYRLSESLDRIDVKAFPSKEDYRGVQNTIVLLQKKAEMVVSSHVQNNPISSPAPVNPEKKKGCWLPWWFVFVGWFLLVSSSGIATYFTLMYGFAYGKETATKWVISLGLSLFQSIFVLQPLKVLALAIFFALTLKTVVMEDSEEVEWILAEQWKSG